MGKISVSGWCLATISLRAWQTRMLALSGPRQLEPPHLQAGPNEGSWAWESRQASVDRCPAWWGRSWGTTRVKAWGPRDHIFFLHHTQVTLWQMRLHVWLCVILFCVWPHNIIILLFTCHESVSKLLLPIYANTARVFLSVSVRVSGVM